MFFKSADSPNIIIRILFVDFAKAFDLVNHNVLLRKFQAYNFPPHITAWSMSFLHERKQFVEVRNIKSSCSVLRAGAPQGTLSGPNLFKLLINDLTFDIDYAKYVDDTTVVSISADPIDQSLQFAADRLAFWCDENSMRINTKKTKEAIRNFSKSVDRKKVPPLTNNGALIERVSSFKLLGIIFSSDLSWGQHVSYILNKVAKRYYIIFQLARIGITPSDIILIYCAIMRSVLEYACAVWHCGLTANQSDDLERVQRRVLRIIYPNLSYHDALFVSGLERLCVRRERITRVLFEDIQNPRHVLHTLLTFKLNHNFNTRDNYLLVSPPARTMRYSNSFIPYCIRKQYLYYFLYL